MKKYKFEIIITEGSDEFWEDLKEKDITGCEQMKESLKNALWQIGFQVGENCELNLKEYKDD